MLSVASPKSILQGRHVPLAAVCCQYTSTSEWRWEFVKRSHYTWCYHYVQRQLVDIIIVVIITLFHIMYDVICR